MSHPWETEPDHVEFKHQGFPCIAHRGPVGAWCGYVGVPPGHRAHGQHYREIEDVVDVHGGLTYADACQGDICHKPAPGEPDDVWWFGFDCAHGGDVSPSMVKLREERPDIFPEPPLLWFGTEEVYRDLAYVQAETRRLAEQLGAMTPLDQALLRKATTLAEPEGRSGEIER